MSVEFVGIELDLRGEEGVLSSLKQIDTLINSLGGKKKVDIGLRQIERDLISARAQLHAYQKDQEGLTKGSTAWRIMQGYIEETKEEIFELTTAAKVARASIKSMGDTFKQTFNKTSSMVTHLGSKMQSFGNALTRFTSPFNRIMTGALYGVGYKALNTLTEGFSQSFARADTMNKYTKLMKEYETANYSAAQSRKDLDESVQGLPIALNDAIAMAQRYTLSLGDMERGTKLAIATNNAFLASMATETQRYQGMLQLQDLMNGKDLQPREWMSLGSSMGKAINEVGKELGYSTEELGLFRQQLYAGKVDTQEFLDALIKVGTGEGSLVGLAKLSAETWEGLFSNIKIATTRMGADIIETLNDTIQKSTGRTLLQQLLGIDAEGKRTYDGVRDWINNMSKSVQNWVKANPDKILNFFNQIKSIKWGSILKGVAQGFSEILRIIGAFSKLASGAGGGKDLSWIGKWMIRLSLLGRFMTIFGGMTKGSSGPVATIVATIKTLRRAAGAGSLMGALKELIGIGGKGSDLGEMGEKMSKTGGSMGKFSLGLSKWFKGWAQVAAAVGGTAFVGFVSFKAVKSMLNDLREMVDIASDIDWAKGAGVLAGMTGFFTGFIALGELVGSKLSLGALKLAGIIGGVATIFSVTFWADMKLIKGGFKSIADATKYMQTAMDNLKSIKPLEGSVITKIREVIGVFNQITELLAIERNNPVTGEGKSGLKELDKKSAKTVENLANSLKNIVSGIKSLNAINDVKLNTENLETNMTALGDAVEAVSTVLDEMPTTMKGEQAQTWSKNIEQATKSFRNAFKNITGTDGILTNLRNITAELRNIDMVSVETQFSRLGQALDTISGSLEGTGADMTFSKRMSNFRAALKSLKYAFGHLNQIGKMKIDAGGAAGKIKEVLNELSNVFGASTTDTLVTQINDLVKALQDAFAQFDQFNKTIVIKAKIKLGNGFNSSGSAAVAKIKKVASDIRSAFNSIPTNLSKTVTIKVVVNTVVEGMDKVRNIAQDVLDARNKVTGGTIYRSGGGSIYRAKGGGIPFPGKPRGTDRVPAWLTAGEYVENKRAVNFFGIDFMRKVNNLDIRGAMDELMYKAGNMASLNSRGTTINNYYNNNQKVVQNISTNSPDFAFRTASRFVGAF